MDVKVFWNFIFLGIIRMTERSGHLLRMVNWLLNPHISLWSGKEIGFPPLHFNGRPFSVFHPLKELNFLGGNVCSKLFRYVTFYIVNPFQLLIVARYPIKMKRPLNLLSFNRIMQEHHGLALILDYFLPISLTLIFVNGESIS